MLGDGHTKVTTGFAMHSYKTGEEEEKLEFSNKDIPTEITAQIARRLEGKKIDITKVKIKRVDLIGGADHGKGAMHRPPRLRSIRGREGFEG